MKHSDQVLQLLHMQIKNPEEVEDVKKTAEEVIRKSVKPLSGGKEESNGLIYGLIQSGKTGVLTVTGAMGADEGYRTILILTSDIDPLYNQTIGRIQEAYPGIDIIGKKDFKDCESFLQRIKKETSAIVCTKNVSLLTTLIDNFKKGNVKGLTCLIIDDEADQASLNTRASRPDSPRSAINDKIEKIRSFFEKNTYIQVTATPQALFLQMPEHHFRPKFTVLSNPGGAYVGGEDFFGDGSELVKEFDLKDIEALSPGTQPKPSMEIPKSLVRALDTFMIGATFKRMNEADQNCAFLCHVSTRKSDHKHIVGLLRKYKADLAEDVRSGNIKVIARLREAYDDLAMTHDDLRKTDYSIIVDKIRFYSPGIMVKLVNGETDEDVVVKSPYNLFVGGNKLGRGVTIKNLLVSYYGRNPKKPQADTVLQHARMYGYRRKDIGLLRLFLPRNLHIVFKAINKMEGGLRDLIGRRPTEEFRGIYLESGLSATRKNVLVPGALGVYSAGSNYNPAQILRDYTVKESTEMIDKMLFGVPNKGVKELSIDEMKNLIQLTIPDPKKSEYIWDTNAIAESLVEFAKIHGHSTGYIYVDRDRDLFEDRRETAGILAGGEYVEVPTDRIALYLLRTKSARGNNASWWPQIRFPDGHYAFAFAV